MSATSPREAPRPNERPPRAPDRVLRVPDAAPEEDGGPSSPGELNLPAKVYYWLVGLAATIAAAPHIARLSSETEGWILFVVLAVSASIAQLFVVRKPNNQSYQTTIVFLMAAAILLPAELVSLVGIVYIPEWLKSRKSWRVQTFNIFNSTLGALAGWATFQLVSDTPFASSNMTFAAAGLAACLALVFVKHLVLANMLRLAYGLSFRAIGLFSVESLSTDFVLTALGTMMAAFWEVNPWLIAFAVAPLLLIHRSLAVPALQEEARVDAKTGLFNARHFAVALSEELGRATRFERPLSLIMADLDLLRDINNTYGHLAGDAVLKGIAEIFRSQLRNYDVPARFGGEEFSILLPETAPEQALEIAERIRRAVAEAQFEVETSSEPIRATVSIGVAGFPTNATDANELIHQADLAVYRAKLQGRNRVLGASSEPLLLPADRSMRLIAVPEEGDHVVPLPPASEAAPPEERRQHTRPRPHALHGPRFLAPSRKLGLLVAVVTVCGALAGLLGVALGGNTDLVGLLAILVLVAVGQALALEVDSGSISVSAVGALAGAAIFGPRAALALALTTVVVEWSARRSPLHHELFNVGTLTLASLAAAGTFALSQNGGKDQWYFAVFGAAAGAAYFCVNMGLLSLAVALEGHERWTRVFRERFAWLLPHYLVYGFIGGVIALAYSAVGVSAFAVFAVPLLLMRKTQEAYIAHTQRSAQKLRQAAVTIQNQNVSLEQANRLLKERSTAAMESLSATVDARDSYTAGHSRRVQQLALAIGRELGLSQAELEVLGQAALFHDIGKLAIPDAILLKPSTLTSEEWALMQRHSDEGARIIDRLGFLNDAVPAIRHHHERFDGTGYPERLKGDEIPLGARIIHVADALDSMLTTRIYRAARPATEAIAELHRGSGTQFCPRCVAALERILPLENVMGEIRRVDPVAAAS
jgi:diguanylate cyclase (GGDEF)-like protein/putative nucleotidyltransferase with HDIG domain